MNRYNHPQQLKVKHYIVRFSFAAVAIALLSVFFPREASKKLQYRLNEPWNYATLIADFNYDFNRNETEQQELNRTVDSLTQAFYQLNTHIQEEQAAILEHDLDSLDSKLMLTASQKKDIVDKLVKTMNMGVLPDSSFDSIASHRQVAIQVYANGEIQHCSPNILFTTAEAYNYWKDDENEAIVNAFKNIKFDKYIKTNLEYDAKKTKDERKCVLRQYCIKPGDPNYLGSVQIGEKIVDKGQIVDDETYDKLLSYEESLNSNQKSQTEELMVIHGVVLYISIIVFALLFFFTQFRSDYLSSIRHMSLISAMCLIFVILTYQLKAHIDDVSEYLIPYCILPIFIRIFMDSRTAFITHLATILLCALTVKQPFEFVTVQAVAGLTAIYSLKQLQQRSELFVAVIWVILVSMLTYLSLNLVNFDTLGWDYKTQIRIACGGGLIFISYLLLFPIEKLFRFTSTVTLVELSNINNEVLRRLSEEAPGTFQHSMQVANLAAEVANKLSANAQLVRTGALYHDIGKLKNPVFFTENQSGVNPHNTLPFEDSAQIIIQHVKYGLELASKYRLPQSIKDFIASHHGRSKTKYFYVSYKNEHPEREINEEIFTYPGPNPISIEEAILMMADAVEAASRSLPEYTEESISTLVDRIIDSQVKDGYFNRCPITFENIDTAKRVFKNKLKSIYHTRISYPELRKTAVS